MPDFSTDTMKFYILFCEGATCWRCSVDSEAVHVGGNIQQYAHRCTHVDLSRADPDSIIISLTIKNLFKVIYRFLNRYTLLS